MSKLTNTYWNNNGKHQAWYKANINTLMPAMGAAATVEGELVRASVKLYYDYYNNGFCNNTSGASNFLKVKDAEFNLGITAELTTIGNENNTGYYTSATLEVELEAVVNAVLEYVIARNGAYSANTDDMFNYADADVYDEDFDEDEYITGRYYDEEDEDGAFENE